MKASRKQLLTNFTINTTTNFTMGINTTTNFIKTIICNQNRLTLLSYIYTEYIFN